MRAYKCNPMKTRVRVLICIYFKPLSTSFDLNNYDWCYKHIFWKWKNIFYQRQRPMRIWEHLLNGRSKHCFTSQNRVNPWEFTPFKHHKIYEVSRCSFTVTKQPYSNLPRPMMSVQRLHATAKLATTIQSLIAGRLRSVTILSQEMAFWTGKREGLERKSKWMLTRLWFC